MDPGHHLLCLVVGAKVLCHLHPQASARQLAPAQPNPPANFAIHKAALDLKSCCHYPLHSCRREALGRRPRSTRSSGVESPRCAGAPGDPLQHSAQPYPNHRTKSSRRRV